METHSVHPPLVRAKLVAGLALSGLLLVGAGCAPPPAKPSAASSSGAATATSASDLGGMDALVAAAKKEGTLNVIALPPDWANYGKIIEGFKAKYGMTVNSAQPDAASQDEINSAKQLKGSDRAPDVFDLGQSVALANTDLFAPYKVATFDSIDAGFKDAGGAWVNDYGGYMSIGYDSKKLPEVTTVDDLMVAGFKGKVALNGNPTQAGAAFSGVMMVSPGQGRLGRRHPARDRLLRGAQEGRQLPARRPDLGDDRVRPDPPGHRLGLPERGRDRQDQFLEGRRPGERPARRLLLPGDQQGRAAPGRGPAVGGVPVLRRGAEPVARRWRPAGPRGRDAEGRHARQGGVRQAPAGIGQAGAADRRPDHEGGRRAEQAVGQGDGLSVRDLGDLRWSHPVDENGGPGRFG